MSLALAPRGPFVGAKSAPNEDTGYTEQCLNNALRLQTYIEDAERDADPEVADLFRKAQSDSRKGAELAERLLLKRL